MARPSARLRIEDAALGLFARKGVEATSIRDIATAAGVSEGALYRHHAGKEALVRALFASRYAELARAVPALAGEGPAAQRLAALIRGLCALHDRSTDAFTFMLVVQHAELPRYDEAAGSPVDAVRDLIAAGIRSGELPDQDPDVATAIVIGIVVQAATFHHYGRLTRPLGDIAPSLATACLRALGLPGDPT